MIVQLKLVKWFKESDLKANGEKCHLLVTTDKSISINPLQPGFAFLYPQKTSKRLGFRR